MPGLLLAEVVTCSRCSRATVGELHLCSDCISELMVPASRRRSDNDVVARASTTDADRVAGGASERMAVQVERDPAIVTESELRLLDGNR